MWRPWVRRAALLLAGAGAVVLFDLAYAATTYGVGVRNGARELRGALRALDRSDASAVAGHLARSAALADLSAERAGRPSLRLVAGLGLEPDVAALEAIAAALADVATAAQHALVPAFEHGAAHRGLFGAFYSDGAVDLDAVAALTEALAGFQTDLATAAADLDELSEPKLDPIASALERLDRRMARTGEGLQRALTTARLLPGLLGAEDERRYLLAFQSPSEARGGGGLIGVYGVLTADDGRLDLGHIGPIEELVPARRRARDRGPRPVPAPTRTFPAVPAPGWYRDLYDRFLGRGDIRHANLTPSFPASAELWLDMYAALTGKRLGGVIALDPLALGEMTRGTGPLEAPGWDRRIGRFSARRVLLHDVYRHFDLKERKQNEYLEGLIDELWDRLESGDVRAGSLARGLAVAAREQHLKIYVPDPTVAELLGELQIDGDYRSAGDDVALVFHNNFAANKVDFFLKRTVSTELRLTDDGSAAAITEVELVNEAPEDRSVLVRPLSPDLPYGVNRMTLSFLLPVGAEPRGLQIDGRDSNLFEGAEYDYPVAWQILDIEAGATRTVRLRWRWPDAWELDPNGPDLELTLWPQALVRPDFAHLVVIPPEGYEVARTSTLGDMTLDRGPIMWRHRPPIALELELARGS